MAALCASPLLLRSLPLARQLQCIAVRTRLSNLKRRCSCFCAIASSGDSTIEAATVPASPAPPVPSNEVSIDALDIRVGRIVKAWKHPEADSLYVEEVELGEDEDVRTICSGLVKYVPEDELQDKLVVVLANLKPRNMKGIKSSGMLLAASNASHEIVELIVPPNGSVPGERIWFGSEEDQVGQGVAATPNQLQKKKTWEALQPKLRTGDDSIVYFETKPMRTSAGVVMAKTLTHANVG